MASTRSYSASTAAVATPTFSLSPSQSRAVQSALASSSALLRPFGGNYTSIAFDAFAYSLSGSQSGCWRKGALPLALATNDTCLPGFYCPNSSNDFPPQYCHPTEFCTAYRANRGTCNAQGWLEPELCQNGYYCPNGKQQTPCPAGFFCPSGSYRPIPCTWGSICPAQTDHEVVMAPLYVTIMLDVVLGIILTFSLITWTRRRSYTSLGTGAFGEKGRFDDHRVPYNTSATASPRVSLSITPPPPSVAPQYPNRTHTRRESNRTNALAGYVDDDDVVSYDGDENIGEDLHDDPDFQRFIHSMSNAIETQSIGLSFDYENLAFETGDGQRILQDVTGTMPRGSMWGIMGGSGAGKTTFLNVLMGKSKHTGGSVKINGWLRNMSQYKKLIGYVPQDDIVFPELTVRENILHSARVRLPASWKDQQIQEHVDSLIACLHLTHVQHSKVGDAVNPVISGGQRKRVNIGIELTAAPMAIFLDEPTTGLDATSAASIMRLLKAISRLGVTTIAIIHQPREQIFYGFDQLLLLTQGRCVYNGPTQDVQNYFQRLGFAFPQHANPADALIDIITGEGERYHNSHAARSISVTQLIHQWKNHGQYFSHTRHLSVGLDGAAVDRPRSRRISNQSISSTIEQEAELHRTMKARGATWPAQVYYCWKRAMTQQSRNITSFLFEVGVGAIAGVIIGLSAFASNGHLFQGLYHPPFTLLSSAVDYASTPQIGLLGAMAIGLSASAPGFWVFGEEKLMYWRETGAGHSRSAYYIGKLLSTIPRMAISSLHFTCFLVILASPLITFGEMYAANLMYFWCIYGLAGIVSMLVKREDGPLIAVLASLVMGIFGGVAPPLSKVKTWNMEWFWRLSPGVWFTEAYFSQNLLPLGYLYQLDIAAETVGFTLRQYGTDVLLLFVIGIVYRIIAYFCLILIKRSRQR